MRHKLGYRKLNKTPEHRKALFKNMLNSLIKYEQIFTTLPKAKELKPKIDKVITIGKKADIPVQISHIKLAMVSLLGKTKKLLTRLNQARKDGIKISADIYPYMYWQ